jgi:hypothetical protein
VPQPASDRVRAALDAQLDALGRPPHTASAADLAELRRACLDAVLAAYDAEVTPHRQALRVAVRLLLDRLAAAAPGRSVEVRVPPYAAVQCVAGPRHTRGTPPNVTETDPDTWIALATGRLSWREAMAAGKISVSGTRADLSGLLPISDVVSPA